MVDGASLENWNTGNRIGGSNPSLSAITCVFNSLSSVVHAVHAHTNVTIVLLAHEPPFTASALRFWQKLGLDRVYIA